MAAGRAYGGSVCRRAGTGARSRSAARTPSVPLRALCGANAFGSFLMRAEVRRQYPYVLFMALLCFCISPTGFVFRSCSRRHDRLTEQVKELRARSLTVSSLRMISTRQSEIIRELELRGIPLEESLSPLESDRKIDDERGQNGYKERHIPGVSGCCTRFSFSSECSLRARSFTCNTGPRDPPYVTRDDDHLRARQAGGRPGRRAGPATDVFWLRPSRCTRYAWISRRTV